MKLIRAFVKVEPPAELPDENTSVPNFYSLVFIVRIGVYVCVRALPISYFPSPKSTTCDLSPPTFLQALRVSITTRLLRTIMS